MLVEKGRATGGSAAYGGFVWTAPTVEVMQEVNPAGRPAARAPAARGLRRRGRLDPLAGRARGRLVTVLGYGRGRATDLADYLLACERLVRDRGELLLQATTNRLVVEDGAVVGAEATASWPRAPGRSASSLPVTSARHSGEGIA